MAIINEIPDEMRKYAKQFDVDVAQSLADNSIANIDGNIFLTTKNSLEIAEEIMKRSNQEPYAIGTFLGNVSNKKFIPSPAFPDLLADKSGKKVNINQKAEWLFLCGRDVFESSIMKSNSGLRSSELKPGNLVLVQNERDEALGVGRVGEKVIKNLLDKGSYLRDEK